MMISVKILPNIYRDSVALMNISASLAKLDGIAQAAMVMATQANLDLLKEANLLDRPMTAQPNDLLIAIEAEDDDALNVAFAAADEKLQGSNAKPGVGDIKDLEARSIQMALEATPQANLALISCPGDYAAAEAMKALRLGLDVMVFSDNVALEDENALKTYADKQNLLVMGPDCGSAIINGLPLGFANVVRTGDIGVVAASGTGLQQITCLVEREGCGVSHALGTGGRDLNAKVGGLSMLAGLKALAADDKTKIIVLVSKPPSPDIAKKVLKTAAELAKPVVVNFLGAENKTSISANLHTADTLEDAAMTAAALSKGKAPSIAITDADIEFQSEIAAMAEGQKYLRGLYSGGTFCYEAQLILQDMIGPIYSSTPVNKKYALNDAWKSLEHTVIDLGDDIFTRGRPHPMIDHRLRNERIINEATDAKTAVILLDVVLGFGAHMDPAGEMAPALEKAQEVAADHGRHLSFIGFICGTQGDPQGFDAQEEALIKAGMILAPSNAAAVRMAGRIIQEKNTPKISNSSARQAP